MPESYSYHIRGESMADAARAGMLITMKCGLCNRSVSYWAADLIQVVGPRHHCFMPPWPCSRCKTSEYISLRCAVLPASEIAEGKIVVRRPVKQVLKWIWRDERV